MHSYPTYASNICAIFFIFHVLCQSLISTNATERPIIVTKLGRLQGSIMNSDYGRDFYAFRRIPYAKPPVNNLRFKLPQPIEPWKGVLNATVDGNICIQIETLVTDDIVGVEDCLYLNVYVPQLPSSEKSETFAVMVYIHGGGYLTGGGPSWYYGPQRFLDKDIILVMINYRLGPFGFLSTGDQNAPGNMGLWDQNLALRWVQNNIDAFGGDPRRVTLFGESAGARCLGFHIISPHSKGLFSSAIYQSGSAVTVKSVSLNPLKYAQHLAENLDCPINSSFAIIQCLQTKQGHDILDIGVSRYKGEQNFVFAPVIDIKYGSPAFIPGVPRKLIANGQFNAVPVLSGATKNEGMYYYLKNFDKYTDDMLRIESVHRLASVLFPDFMVDLDNGPKVTKEFIDESFKNVDPENLTQVTAKLSDLVTDSIITEWTDFTNEMTAAGATVYAYKLTYKGRNSLMRVLPKGNAQTAKVLKDLNIVVHADDLQYLFHWETIFPNSELLGNDRVMADIMLSYWTNFAKTSEPFLDGPLLKYETHKWQAMSPGNHTYMQLDLAPKMVSGKLCSAPSLWEKMLKRITVKWPVEERSLLWASCTLHIKNSDMMLSQMDRLEIRHLAEMMNT